MIKKIIAILLISTILFACSTSDKSKKTFTPEDFSLSIFETIEFGMDETALVGFEQFAVDAFKISPEAGYKVPVTDFLNSTIYLGFKDGKLVHKQLLFVREDRVQINDQYPYADIEKIDQLKVGQSLSDIEQIMDAKPWHNRQLDNRKEYTYWLQEGLVVLDFYEDKLESALTYSDPNYSISDVTLINQVKLGMSRHELEAVLGNKLTFASYVYDEFNWSIGAPYYNGAYVFSLVDDKLIYMEGFLTTKFFTQIEETDLSKIQIGDSREKVESILQVGGLTIISSKDSTSQYRYVMNDQYVKLNYQNDELIEIIKP